MWGRVTTWRWLMAPTYCGNAGATLQRLHDVVLPAHAWGLLGRMRLGRAQRGPRQLAARGDGHRRELLGPPRPDARGGCSGAAAGGPPPRSPGAARTGLRDGWELSAYGWRLPLVGRNEGSAVVGHSARGLIHRPPIALE